MFLDGMHPGAKDDSTYEQYKKKNIDGEIYPNIVRWRNYMKCLKE